jgi:DNA-binding MarR family transcriptional regulator
VPDSRQAPRHSRADLVDVRRRAWRATFQATHTLVGVLDQELREATGMDIQTYDTLLQTFEAGDEGIRMSDLARAVSLTKAGLTALVDRLETRGLLERVNDSADRRVIRIKLTKDGDKAFRAAAKVHVAGINEHMAQHLTDEQAEVIVEALEHIRSLHTA